MADTLQITTALSKQWEATPQKFVPTNVSLLAANAKAILLGYQETQPEKPLPTQVLDYCSTGIFKVGVFDKVDNLWHFLLLKQLNGEKSFKVRYVDKRKDRHYNLHNSVYLPEGKDLKALGMAKVESDKSTEFRCDLHWSTIASVIGVAHLVKKPLPKNTSWQYLVSGFCPVLPVQTSLPKTFTQWLPEGKKAAFTIERQITACKGAVQMVVYKRDQYWRAQPLERIRQMFPD